MSGAVAYEKRKLAQYGLEPDDYHALLEAQGGGCAICGTPPNATRALAVDHDHETGAVRGILCGRCNPGLGHFKDDPLLLEKAAHYLRLSRVPD
jgi:hypothetical protein